MRKGLFATGATLSLMLFQAGYCAEADRSVGIKLYERKDYEGAAESLTKQVKERPSAAGKQIELLTPKPKLTKPAKSTAQSSQGTPSPVVASSASSAQLEVFKPAPLNVTNTVEPDTPERLKRMPFKERIFVVPPRYGHKPVRPSTVQLARKIVQNLPPQIYTMLDKGGATISLSPNIMDKWPGSADGHRPGPLDIVMGEEVGRCYDRHIYNYEASVIRGTTKLGRPYSENTLKEAIYGNIGHAIDDCLGIFTTKAPVPGLYYADIDEMPAHVRKSLIQYAISDQGGCSMTCSAIIGILLGSPWDEKYDLLEYFPRTTKYIKEKLQLIGYKKPLI